MSKTFVYDRFDFISPDPWVSDTQCISPNSEGDYVKAQDALNRDAVLQARIRTLEVQLKDREADIALRDKLILVLTPKTKGG